MPYILTILFVFSFAASTVLYAQDSIIKSTEIKSNNNHTRDFNDTVHDKTKLALKYKGLGKKSFLKGEYPAALDHYLEALRLFQDMGNKKECSSVYNLLAKVYHFQSPNTFTKAEDYCRKAIKIQQELHDSNGLINSYMVLGDLFSDIIADDFFNLDTAEYYYKKALNIALKTKTNKKKISKAYSAVGKVYYKANKTDSALLLLKRSLAIQKEINDSNEIALTYQRMANTYKYSKNYTKSLKYLHKALSFAEKMNNLDLTNNICEDISSIYTIEGNYKKALFYYKKAVEIKFQLYTNKRIEKVAYYQTKYETERKEKEIMLLTKEKEIHKAEIEKEKAESNKQRVLLYSFVIGFFMLLVLAIVIYKAYRNKISANNLLAYQKEEISNKHKLLQNQKEEIESQKSEIEKQNQKLDIANREIKLKSKNITDSIKYAQRIQSAILPPLHEIKKAFPESFVLFLPQSIVSGDFYWIEQKHQYIYIAAVDCTGHGAPGALMSIIGYNLLNQALNEKGLIETSEIINYLNCQIAKTLRQSDNESLVHDGMDLVLCRIDSDSKMMSMSGIHNAMYLIRNNELGEFRCDYHPLTGDIHPDEMPYGSTEIQLEKGDVIYLFTDGYMDQFHEKTGKKFTAKRFKNLLLSISGKEMEEQQKILMETYLKWKGKAEQTDDTMVLGIKIS